MPNETELKVVEGMERTPEQSVKYVDANNRWTKAITQAPGEVLDAFDKLLGSPFGPIFK